MKVDILHTQIEHNEYQKPHSCEMNVVFSLPYLPISRRKRMNCSCFYRALQLPCQLYSPIDSVLNAVLIVKVATTLGAILRSEKAKAQLCGVFGSFGWSGEAVDELEGRLKVLPASLARNRKGMKRL